MRSVAAIAGAGAWAALAASVLDLVWRQLTRTALVEAAGGPLWRPSWSVIAAGLAAAWLIARPAATSRRRGLALFLFLFAAGSFAQAQLGARLQSDGFYYYAYARSIWFDGDVDLTNDYRLLGLDDPQHRHLFQPTPTGYAQTTWAIGPALAWSPFFALGHGAALWTAARRPNVAVDGASFPYRQAICLAGLFYGLAGLFACFAIARTSFTARVAAAAVVGVGAGSFVLWYLVREPTMSHAVSMAAVSLVVLMWVRLPREAPVSTWALLGLAGGFMVATRWQNAIVLLLPAAALAAEVRASWMSVPARRRVSGAGLAFAAAAIAGFLPQMLAWRAIYGRWLARSPIAPEMHWADPQIADLLWSSRNGLFATSPVLYLAAIGLVLLWRRDRVRSAAGLVVFALMIWTNGAVHDWWGGAGYGGRRFDSMIPFFTLGLAALSVRMSDAVRRRPGVVATAALALLVVWNVLLMTVARGGRTYRIGQPVSFGELAAAQARALHGAVGHVPSYPANLLYAARNGVAPARYDRLRPLRLLGDPSRAFGGIDVGTPPDDEFLMAGWHAPERSRAGTFRWARREAGLIVPLDHPAPLRLQIRLEPFADASSAPQRLAAVINGMVVGEQELAAGWQVVEFETPVGVWRTGVNRVELRFARETRPADLGAGDRRPLSAAVDYVRVEVMTRRD